MATSTVNVSELKELPKAKRGKAAAGYLPESKAVATAVAEGKVISVAGKDRAKVIRQAQALLKDQSINYTTRTLETDAEGKPTATAIAIKVKA